MDGEEGWDLHRRPEFYILGWNGWCWKGPSVRKLYWRPCFQKQEKSAIRAIKSYWRPCFREELRMSLLQLLVRIWRSQGKNFEVNLNINVLWFKREAGYAFSKFTACVYKTKEHTKRARGNILFVFSFKHLKWLNLNWSNCKAKILNLLGKKHFDPSYNLPQSFLLPKQWSLPNLGLTLSGSVVPSVELIVCQCCPLSFTL